jgi:hypothetical protein
MPVFLTGFDCDNKTQIYLQALIGRIRVAHLFNVNPINLIKLPSGV